MTTNIAALVFAGGGIWGNIEGKMRPIDNLFTSGLSLIAYATGKGDKEAEWMKAQVRKLVGGLGEDDRAAVRGTGRILLDWALGQWGYRVELKDEQPTRMDYVGGAISDRPGPSLTEIQPQDNRAVAIEEARQLRRRFDMPARIDPVEHSQWAEWNDRGGPDEDGVIGTEGWP